MIQRNWWAVVMTLLLGVWLQLGQIASAEMSGVRHAATLDAGAQALGAPAARIWYENFDAGWRESRRRGLPMVVYITSDHCIYCDAMKRDTWGNDGIVSQLRGGYIAIRLHRDRDSAVLSRIVVPAYPTTLIASPEGKVISHRVGYQPPSEIRRFFAEALSR